VSCRYGFIDAEKASYPVTKMCEWMGVSRSGCHEWRGRADSATVARQERLKTLMALRSEPDSVSAHIHRVTVVCHGP